MQFINKKRLAFTLAEVLITLGVIGVVSAMTLPTLFSNYQSEALAKKKLLFDGRLEEAMNQMRFHEKLTGYSSATDFVDELGKYLKIDVICDNDELTDCFADIIHTSTQDLTTEDDLATGMDIGTIAIKADLFENNIGVIFADGVHAILNYKDGCDWLDPYDGGADRAKAGNCVSLVYDLNGLKGRNTAGNDVNTYNAVIDCVKRLDNGSCITTTATQASALTYSECMAQKDDLGIDECCSTTDCSNADYWAGAVAQCGGVDYVVSAEDLMIIANEVYDITLAGSQSTYWGEPVYTEVLSTLSITNSAIWASDYYTSSLAFDRSFRSTYTSYGDSITKKARYNSSVYILCKE
ncbi:MAG: type II secretion system protein [Candidatus Gastranaerophilales bacterium]